MINILNSVGSFVSVLCDVQSLQLSVEYIAAA